MVRLVEGMEEMRDLAGENQKKVIRKKKAREQKFEVGELALVHDHNKMQGFKRELSGPC